MRSVIAMVGLVLAAGSGTSLSAQSGLAITGVSVVDVERGRVIPDQVVLVQDGRVTAVEPSRRARLPTGTVPISDRSGPAGWPTSSCSTAIP